MTSLDYLYNPNATKKSFVDKKLTFQIIEQGLILPHKDTFIDGKWTWGKGGIVDSNGKGVKGTHVDTGVDEIYTPPPRIDSISLRNCHLSWTVVQCLGTCNHG